MLINNPLYQADLEHIGKYLTFLKGSTILITGASGLIGSCLIDALIHYNCTHDEQISVYGTSRRQEKLYDRFGYSKPNENVNFFAQDVCLPLNEYADYEYIVHAASNADPKSYALYPVETIKTNVLGTANALEYARIHMGTKVLLTSTMEVYGDVPNCDMHNEEQYGLLDFNNIRSGYPESKRVSELLCRSYMEEYGVDTKIARLGYIYGPSMTAEDNKVIAQFLRNAIEGKDIVLKSKGVQRRSYCYVVDTIVGILCILSSGRSGEAYNISNGNSTVTIAELAEAVAQSVGKRVIFDLPNVVEHGHHRVSDAVLDETKLRGLGYMPQYNIAEGIARTIAVLMDEK